MQIIFRYGRLTDAKLDYSSISLIKILLVLFSCLTMEAYTFRQSDDKISHMINPKCGIA